MMNAETTQSIKQPEAVAVEIQKPQQQHPQPEGSREVKTQAARDPKEYPRFRNRGRNAIVANLLSLAEPGITKTHLMFQANLSYSMLKAYERFLKEAGLIVELKSQDGRKCLLKTSERGRRFLRNYNELMEISGHIVDHQPFKDASKKFSV